MVKVSHITTVHQRLDIRIFIKECSSLAEAGFDVALIVADGRGDEDVEKVAIFDVGRSRGRIERMFKTTGRAFAKAVALDADIYHLHDPELIPVGLKLKRLGKKVLFDAHEDLPRQLLDKPYLNKPARWLLSRTFSTYEKRACRHFDAIITATPFIRDKFLAINPRSIDINNFPLLGELVSEPESWTRKESQVCYVGGIALIRGIREIVRAMEDVEGGGRLQLVGKFSESDVEREAKKYPGWSRVDELGWLDRPEVRRVLARSVAGLVTFYPLGNHMDAQPNKMFEYMSASIPVIASHFPLWRDIVEGNSCGICVDPLDPRQIATAINTLLADHELAATMGKNGRKAVEAVYNWHNEEQKLINLYQEIL